MKHLLPATGLILSVLALGSCSKEPTAPHAVQPASQPGTEPAKPAAPATHAEQTASIPASAPVASAAQPGAQAAEGPNARALDPANARGGARYLGAGDEDKLDPSFDPSKVKLNDAPAADHDHAHDHDHGHDAHAEEEKLAQDGSSLLPDAQARRFQGRIELAEGVQQVNDLGKLRQGEAASFDYSFVSNGEDALVISGVKPSCGCTKAEIVLLDENGERKPYTKGDPIPVGQKFILETEISTDGKPGGPFNAQISIYSNDIRGAFNVRLTADIEPMLSVSPSQSVFFGRLTTAQSAEQTITVSTTRGEPFLLTLGQEVVQEPLRLEYHAKNPDAEGKSSEWEIKVAIGPNGKIGMNSYPLSFKTDLLVAHPKYPSHDGTPPTHGLVLNVQAQVVGMVSAEPPFLTFGMVKPGEAIERSLRLESHDPDFPMTADIPVIFEGLQGQEFPFADAFSVTVEPQEDGAWANVKVLLKGMPNDLNGSFGGVLRLKVNHPSMDELQVRFSGVCRPGLPVNPVGQK